MMLLLFAGVEPERADSCGSGASTANARHVRCVPEGTIVDWVNAQRAIVTPTCPQPLSLRIGAVEEFLLALGQQVERIIETAPGVANAREDRIVGITVGDAVPQGDIAVLVHRRTAHPSVQQLVLG